MKNKLLIVMCILCSVVVAAQAAVIIGGDTLNGNFNTLLTSGTGAQTFSNTANWDNIAEVTAELPTLDTEASKDNLAYDGTRNITVGANPGKIKWHGQNTGYTISAGDVFDISYVWRDAFGWADATEQIEVSLFVTDTDDLTGVKTILVGDLGELSVADSSWQAVDHDGIYTAVAADVGKTLMVGIRSSLAPQVNHFARLDNFELWVSIPVVATNPDPYDGEAVVEITRQLSWSAPGAYTGATYDVYLGSNADVRSNPKVINNKLGTTYDPPVDLLWGTTYYWVVDSYAGEIKYEGTAWSFTTGGQITEPYPTDGQPDVEPIGMASWTGDGAIALYDIYFAASGETLIFVANTADTTVSMKVLAAAIGLDVLDSEGNYQWRVDARDGGGALMRTGDLWTFTVRAYTCQEKIQMGFKKRADMDNNCSVDILDLAILARQWLLEYNPN
jgi:hypothetical protein